MIDDPTRLQVLTVAQMQAAEQALVDSGIGVDELMQRAGRGAAEWAWRMAAGRPMTVLCGPGNNGGDGYVMAEILRERGSDVAIVAPSPPATAAATKACETYRGAFCGAGERRGALFVDCLFGSGLNRALSDELTALVAGLAASHDLSLAMDLPSNVSSDDGRLLGSAPQYDLTLGLGAWKYAHALMPGMARMGALRLADIGVARGEAAARMIGRPVIAPLQPDAHKYTRGMLAVIGGAMPGAAILACEAAMRAGAGYVKLLSEHSHPAAPADLVVEEGDFERALADDRFDALLVGPGLGRDENALRRLSACLARDLPTVLDADALVLLRPEDLSARTAPLIATPHEGEMAMIEREFGCDSNASKPERARSLARALGAAIVAKGADTLVAAPSGELVFAGSASSWLSTAGTGDVLAGIIVSRLATGEAPLDAACQALALHGEAAHLLGAAFTASELARAVPRAMAAFA